MQCFQVLIGPIASGKSTYSATAALRGAVVVNDDAIVNAVHSGQYNLYDRTLKPLYKQVENVIATTAASLGRSVIVDRGVNNSVKSRRRWVGLAHSLDLPVVAVVFEDEGPETHAKRRAEADGRGFNYSDWLRVAQRHSKDFEAPSLEEGFDLIEQVSWDAVSKRYYLDPSSK